MNFLERRISSMTRDEILNAAAACVSGDRQQDYGSPERSFAVIADLWTIYLGSKCVSTDDNINLFPEDVAAMMALFKVARIATGHGKADNWIDLAGYAACGGELEMADDSNG